VADRKPAKRATQFQRASEGSMTLFEHLRELRGRLLKASIGVLVGMIVGFVIATPVINFLTKPYCDYQLTHTGSAACSFSAGGGPLDPFLVTLKVALYVGLLISAPVWLYQLWAFIAPGLHRHERRHTYVFAAIAAPLFAAGVLLAHFIVAKSLRFFLGTGHFTVIVDVGGYFSFVTNVMLLFGAAFEFPLLIIMLNMVGIVSGRRLLHWWRPAVFLMFLFGAIVTPTPDPFGMSILAACMAMLYFAAVGVALYHDRRKARRSPYAGLADDEASPLAADDADPIEAGTPVAVPEAVLPSRPVSTGYDDFT